MINVEMKDGGVQGRKLRKVISPRKSFTSSSSSSSTSPACAGLDNFLRDGTPNKNPRRIVTPSPFRFALITSKEFLNPESPPSSPTRIHKPAFPAQIPSDLSIPLVPIANA